MYIENTGRRRRIASRNVIELLCSQAADRSFETLYAVGHQRAVVWSIHEDEPAKEELLPPIEEV